MAVALRSSPSLSFFFCLFLSFLLPFVVSGWRDAKLNDREGTLKSEARRPPPLPPRGKRSNLFLAPPRARRALIRATEFRAATKANWRTLFYPLSLSFCSLVRDRIASVIPTGRQKGGGAERRVGEFFSTRRSCARDGIIPSERARNGKMTATLRFGRPRSLLPLFPPPTWPLSPRERSDGTCSLI